MLYLSIAFLLTSMIYCRSVDINGLIGYIGGYIGLFVGYSILQIPKTLLTLTRKSKDLFHDIQNQNDPIISVGTRVNVHERARRGIP